MSWFDLEDNSTNLILVPNGLMHHYNLTLNLNNFPFPFILVLLFDIQLYTLKGNILGGNVSWSIRSPCEHCVHITICPVLCKPLPTALPPTQSPTKPGECK